MKIVYMGTPDFAVPSLEALVRAGHEVACVVTQPDAVRDRGKKIKYSPVKEKALELGIPVLQPVKVRKDAEFLQQMQQIAPDLIAVAAYGQILPKEILELPEYGCLNVHGSLLPRFRGAAPIQRAIIEGDEETGITIMYMEEGLDTGDMLRSGRLAIPPDMTAGELYDALADEGAVLLSRTLREMEAGTLRAVPQPAEGATYAPMLDRSLSPMDWRKPASVLHNQVRGLNPWPSASCSYEGKCLKIHVSRVGEDGRALPPGTVAGLSPLTVVCGGGMSLELLEVQYEGSRRMAAADFLRGHPMKVGERLQ